MYRSLFSSFSLKSKGEKRTESIQECAQACFLSLCFFNKSRKGEERFLSSPGWKVRVLATCQWPSPSKEETAAQEDLLLGNVHEGS